MGVDRSSPPPPPPAPPLPTLSPTLTLPLGTSSRHRQARAFPATRAGIKPRRLGGKSRWVGGWVGVNGKNELETAQRSNRSRVPSPFAAKTLRCALTVRTPTDRTVWFSNARRRCQSAGNRHHYPSVPTAVYTAATEAAEHLTLNIAPHISKRKSRRCGKKQKKINPSHN